MKYAGVFPAVDGVDLVRKCCQGRPPSCSLGIYTMPASTGGGVPKLIILLASRLLVNRCFVSIR
jgi:hypothetical protein